tara:strand:+ start:1852 stop:3126 length:1275 start_codon:yes stop_codon:yes gene_type:complete
MAEHHPTHDETSDAPCPFATVLSSDDLTRLVLRAGGLCACASFSQLSQGLRAVAKDCADEWADLSPCCTSDACGGALQNPSYMVEVAEGLLVSSCCAAGGQVGKLHLVSTDDDRCQLVRTLWPRLPRAAHFSSPRGVALDESGEWIYVVDRDTNRVLKMSYAGTTGLDVFQLIRTRQRGGGRRRRPVDEPLPLACPQGLCAHDGTIFVADRDNHRVLVLASQPNAAEAGASSMLSDVLTQTAAIGGSPGDEPGQLYCPMGLAVLETEGALVVCDSMNSRLQLFGLAPPHALIRLFGTEGGAPGQFRGPFGVCVSRSSSAGGALLHVAEAAGARLQTLTTEGVPLQVLPLPGCSFPFGVCATASRVVVSDFHGGLHVLASRRAGRAGARERSHGDRGACCTRTVEGDDCLGGGVETACRRVGVGT